MNQSNEHAHEPQAEHEFAQDWLVYKRARTQIPAERLCLVALIILPDLTSVIKCIYILMY